MYCPVSEKAYNVYKMVSVSKQMLSRGKINVNIICNISENKRREKAKEKDILSLNPLFFMIL